MSIRDRFPILARKTYLNSCSQGALSTDVIDAYQRYLDDWQERGSPWGLWVELQEEMRGEMAALLGADPDEIALTTSASAGLNALASALSFDDAERRRVVVSDFEFPTVGQIWHAQERRGAEVVHVPAAGDDIPPERFAELIDERTKLVSIAHVCFRNGSKLDVPAIVDIAHRNGALVLLDGYQSVGSMRVDVRDLGVDFLIGGTLKYLLASAGLGYLYVRRDLVPTLEPTAAGWFSQADIFAMDIHANVPSPTARRFQAGTPPIPSIYAGVAGVRRIRAIGIDAVEEAVAQVTGAITARAQEAGFTLGSPADPARHGALVSLRSHDVAALVTRLESDDVITSSRNDNLRISPHVYNDLTDVDRLFAALERHRELLT
jgi:selenocysteine lyase/cysteine desulfurase